MTEQYFLGTDGGGTSCRTRITDSNFNIVGESVTGSANLFQNPGGTFESIILGAKEALKGSGITMDQLHAGIGLAGGGIGQCQDSMRSWKHPFKSMVFSTDAKIACIGAHMGNSGAILIIGTGICGWIENDSLSHSISGWGFPIADQGSGAWLGLRVIQETLNGVDRLTPHSNLTLKVLDYFNDKPDTISFWSKTASSGDFGQFARWVVDAEKQNDPVANQLMSEQLAIIQQFINRIQRQNPTKAMSLMGGLAPVIQSKLDLSIQKSLSAPKSDAITGALLMAMKDAGNHDV